MKILVTGANGFIGQALCRDLVLAGYEVIRTVRSKSENLEFPVGQIHGATDWGSVLSLGIDVVVHLAAKSSSRESIVGKVRDEFFNINTEGTTNLANQCAKHNVKRFIFLSSIKVLGEGRDAPYCTKDTPQPTGAYAISKWHAEQSLSDISKNNRMQIVVLRPPLVYGPGVKGHFLTMMRAVDLRLPLPFSAIENRRSLIYVGNLVSAIQTSITHPDATGKTWMVSDLGSISTPELFRRIAHELHRPVVQFRFPVSWLKKLGHWSGQSPMIDRLVGSLAVNIDPFVNELKWTSPFTMEEGLKNTVSWYKNQRNLNLL